MHVRFCVFVVFENMCACAHVCNCLCVRERERVVLSVPVFVFDS